MSSQAEGRRTGLTAPHPLAQIRRSHGWSYQELARVVAENARALGVPMAARREKVWRWEHWGVVPEPDSQRALARALGVPLCELDASPWPRWLPAHGGVNPIVPWTPAGSLAALRSLVDQAPKDPREAPVLTGEALREVVADWARASATACRPPGGTRDSVVDEQTASWLEQGVAGLRRLDDRLGGAAVLPRVEADLRTVADLLACGSYSRAVGVRLHRVAADLAQLGGWTCTDSGRHAAAQRYYLTGLRLAHSAGDRPLGAAMLAGLSLQAVLTGHPGDALHLADAAAHAAQGTGSPRLRAMLATRQARAHAALGDEAACRRALAEAEERLVAAPRYRDPPWIYWFDAAELAAQSGTCLLDLGLADEARTVLDGALDAQGRDYSRDHAVYAVRAATAHLLAGDVGRSRRLAERARRLSRHCGSPRLTAALDDFRTLLAERTSALAAREAGDTEAAAHAAAAVHPHRSGEDAQRPGRTASPAEQTVRGKGRDPLPG